MSQDGWCWAADTSVPSAICPTGVPAAGGPVRGDAGSLPEPPHDGPTSGLSARELSKSAPLSDAGEECRHLPAAQKGVADQVNEQKWINSKMQQRTVPPTWIGITARRIHRCGKMTSREPRPLAQGARDSQGQGHGWAARLQPYRRTACRPPMPCPAAHPGIGLAQAAVIAFLTLLGHRCRASSWPRPRCEDRHSGSSWGQFLSLLFQSLLCPSAHPQASWVSGASLQTDQQL